MQANTTELKGPSASLLAPTALVYTKFLAPFPSL